MKRTLFFFLATALLLAACSRPKDRFEALNERAAKEYLEPLRPGYEGRNPYWNVFAKRFLYAPAFDFKEVEGAKTYRFVVRSLEKGTEWTFLADAPWRPLSPVWNDIPVGDTELTVLALGRDKAVLDTAGTRKFFRDYPFQGPYPGPVVPYREAALKAALYLHTLPYVQRFAVDMEPDLENYEHFSCACKVIGAVVSNECLIARELPHRREEALAIARGAALFLVSQSQPADAPLAGFPPTYYKGKLQDKEEHRGKTMTMEAAKGAGPAFLDMYDLTGEKEWLDRALTIARTYRKLQRPDGSFPIKMDFYTGEPVNNANAMLHPLLNFLRRLQKQYGFTEFQDMAAAGEKWMRAVPLADFDLEGQFEDTSVMGLEPYENLTNCTASPYADYLLTKDHPTEEDIADARDLIRLSEDQFVHWAYPYGPDGIRTRCAPCVHEQYKYETPIDNSSCNVANPLLSYYELTGDRLAFEKAKALLDNLTIVQNQTSGMMPTALVFRNAARDMKRKITINCCFADVKTLMRMHELTQKMHNEK